MSRLRIQCGIVVGLIAIGLILTTLPAIAGPAGGQGGRAGVQASAQRGGGRANRAAIRVPQQAAPAQTRTTVPRQSPRGATNRDANRVNPEPTISGRGAVGRVPVESAARYQGPSDGRRYQATSSGSPDYRNPPVPGNASNSPYRTIAQPYGTFYRAPAGLYRSYYGLYGPRYGSFYPYRVARPGYVVGAYPTFYGPGYAGLRFGYYPSSRMGYWGYSSFYPLGPGGYGWLPVLGWGNQVYLRGLPYAGVYRAAPYYYAYRLDSQAATAARPPSAAAGAVAPRNADALYAEYHLAAARAFREGQYETAARLAGHAALENPAAPEPHEIISLALFALGDYAGAAIEAHAVAHYGGRLDWSQIRALYGRAAPYEAHLRALEDVVKSGRATAESQFLLGYHYYALAHTEAAIRILKGARELAPDDPLIGQLLAELGAPAEELPTPGAAEPQGGQAPEKEAQAMGQQ